MAGGAIADMVWPQEYETQHHSFDPWPVPSGLSDRLLCGQGNQYHYIRGALASRADGNNAWSSSARSLGQSSGGWDFGVRFSLFAA